MKKLVIGIDLGSTNTTIYSSQSDAVVFAEPTCIAINPSSRQIREYGFLASNIKDKAPFNYQIINPVINGFLADSEAAFLFLTKIFENVNLNRVYRGATYLFAAPSLSTKVNTNALINLAKSLSAKEIYIESQAKLAALGCSSNVYSPSATLVCHIGSGVTDVAILSMGQIVSVASTNIASESIDEAIRRYLIQKQHLAVGLKSAEHVKMRIGNVSSIVENQLMEIKGRDTITSLPSSIVVSSSELRNVIRPLLDHILLKVTDVISTCKPELTADIAKNGLLLTGGGALLGGIKDYFQTQLSIPVKQAEKPAEAVADGMRVFISNLTNKAR